MQRPIGRRENGKVEVWMESGELEGLSVKSGEVRATKVNRYWTLMCARYSDKCVLKYSIIFKCHFYI